MVNLKPGDRVDCRVKANIIVSPYKNCDETKTFEIVATDSHGCYLYIPSYLTIKGSVKADKHQCQQLNINSKFLDEQILYIQFNMIYQISVLMDGMTCIKCGEFYRMAESNRENGTLICWLCRNNPYR